jgi:HK97 family phage prohead protease
MSILGNRLASSRKMSMRSTHALMTAMDIVARPVPPPANARKLRMEYLHAQALVDRHDEIRASSSVLCQAIKEFERITGERVIGGSAQEMRRDTIGLSSSKARSGFEFGTDGEGVRGYAAVFYDGTPGSEYQFKAQDKLFVRERIDPHAFDQTVQVDDVRGLFNHDTNLLLGRTKSGTLKLRVDTVGLRYSIPQLPESPNGRNVRESLRRGDVSGSSIGFTINPNGERWTKQADGTYVVEILSVRLFDVSPVTFPAYEGTTAGATV